MHAVFDGREAMTVFLFDSEQDARAWMLTQLLEEGHIERAADDSLRNADDDERYESADTAIDEYQYSLGCSEYFHDYPVVDLRDTDAPHHHGGNPCDASPR